MKKEGNKLKEDDLKKFSYDMGLFAAETKLEFKAELSGSGSGLEGKKCDFDLIFEGWQNNFSKLSDGGFWDREVMASKVKFESVSEIKNVVINEVEYDSKQSDTDSIYEWFEIYNPNNHSVTLKNWTITDNSATDVIPEITIPGKGFAVVAAKESGFKTNYSSFSGNIVYISDNAIGNGLANDGDRLILKNEKGEVADAMSYGSDKTIFDPSCSGVTSNAGHSLARNPTGYDSDKASDFIKLTTPTPGY